MQIENSLENYRAKINPLLKKYFQQKIKKVSKIDPLAVGAVREIERLTLAGGKRIRPALVYWGFLIAGGKETPAILKASLSIELVHSFLLIHDDIIDRDEKRHNINTVNKNYCLLGSKFFSDQRESQHFGNSMALVVGDMAYSMANEILFESNFSAEIILTALKKIQDIVYRTIPGEMLDILLDAKGEATEEEILKMYDGKTARYTFEGPLHLGVCLAGKGADQELLKIFSDYAIPLGQAFQIQDDILGIFGDEKKLGKSVGSDIVEGKQTLLLIRSLLKANVQQKKRLRTLLGKKDLSMKELLDFQKIIKDTGSLESVQKTLKDLINKSQKALMKIKLKTKNNAFVINSLKELTEYIILRKV